MQRLKIATILLGDIVILYVSLAIALSLRRGQIDFQIISGNLAPFSIIFIFWILIFYLFNFYSNKFFQRGPEFLQTFIFAIAINIGVSISLFYIFSSFFGLTPKTVLFIFSIIFAALDYGWRFGLFKLFISTGLKKQILFVGNSANASMIISYLNGNPQLGYIVHSQIKENIAKEKFQDLTDLIIKNKIEAVIISSEIKKDLSAIKFIYRLLPLNVKIFDLSDFYEEIFQKVPLEEVAEIWFVEQITSGRHFYDAVKRTIDVVLSAVMFAVFLIPIALIAVLIKLTSRGSAIFKQERIGKNDKSFIIYKFRTMKAVHNGPLATEKNDTRITLIGKIIRFTHLDELPQLINILKGDISFIGPRPESSKLVEIYKQLPYYEIRHIIKPGITGWAQVNYKPSASLEEAYEKLQYDIYYIKNRSLVLDFLILIKTIRYLFTSL